MPWVSAALMVLMALGFFVTGMGTESLGRGQERAEKAIEIGEFLVDHPYLAAPAEMGTIFGEEFLEQKRLARGRYLAENRPPPPDVLSSEKLALEALSQALSATTRGLSSHEFGFFPSHPTPVSAITHLFLHAGWLHLLANLLFFFVVGPTLEEAYGWVVFLLLFLTSGCAAATVHAWRFPDATVPLIGASGAIAGVMGAYLIRLAGSRIAFLFLPVVFLPFWRYRFHAPAFIVLPLWFIQQLAEARDASSMGGVAFWAHIGGFCFGAGVALVLKVTGAERHLGPALEPPRRTAPAPRRTAQPGNATATPGQPLASSGIRTLSGGSRRVPTASPASASASFPIVETEPAAEMTQALEAALRAGETAAAMQIAERLLEIHVRSADAEGAFALIRAMRRRVTEGLSPRFALAAAAFLETQDDPSYALAVYSDIARRFPSEVASLRSLIKIAELKARFGDPRSARAALDQARQHPKYAPEWDSLIDTAMDRGFSKQPS